MPTWTLDYSLTVFTSSIGGIAAMISLWATWKNREITRDVEVKVDATHLIINSQRTAMVENAATMQKRIESLEKRIAVLTERAEAAGTSTH